jgi:hypothetical protein
MVKRRPLTEKQKRRMNVTKNRRKESWTYKKYLEEVEQQKQYKRKKKLNKIEPAHKHHHFKGKKRKLI